jgi:hypothetical protein
MQLEHQDKGTATPPLWVLRIAKRLQKIVFIAALIDFVLLYVLSSFWKALALWSFVTLFCAYAGCLLYLILFAMKHGQVGMGRLKE